MEGAGADEGCERECSQKGKERVCVGPTTWLLRFHGFLFYRAQMNTLRVFAAFPGRLFKKFK